MKQIHSLLKRQLKKYSGDFSQPPADWEDFINSINEAYHEFDIDREMLERSLDLSSKELLQANSEMQSVLKALPDVFLWVKTDGTITRCKEGTSRELIMDTNKLVGKNIQDIPDRESSIRFKNAINYIKQNRSIAIVEYTLQINGQEQYYEARLLPLNDEEIIVFIRNITAKHKIEEEQLKASKLESIGVLAGGIAHDFNNLLTIIMGNVSMAQMVAVDNELLQAVLLEAEKASCRAQNLTQQLLTFSRGGSPVKKTSSVPEIIKDSTDFALRGSNVRSQFSIDKDLWLIDADSGQIAQVFHNLIVNADQSMEEGGVIEIRAENATIQENGSLPVSGGNYVKILVTDHGGGIEKEHISKIFDPYFTTKQKGNGLGLAVVYSILKNHDGCITVESEPGQGSTFTVYLPAISENTSPQSDSDIDINLGNGRILIMDDEKMVRDIVSLMLQNLGYETATAVDGREAFDRYKEAFNSKKPFDAVLMDLTIPGGIGGKEAIQMLREFDPDIKAIVSSGFANDPILADYQKYGFMEVIPKPYVLKTLCNVMTKVLCTQKTN